MVNFSKRYFFCGVGGSGMAPLAAIMRGRGAVVDGSDRTLDQGRMAAKFEYLRSIGVGLYPQDGSGLTGPDQILVASAAVEDTVPDVIAAEWVGAGRLSRAELLAELFNAAPRSVAVGGTSGKSTTTAMLAWILHVAGRDPTVMNGAVMKNFARPGTPYASALVGGGDLFVSEVDESDGSIALFSPRVAVLNNIAFDHKPMEELTALFGDFATAAEIAVLNLDNRETAAIARAIGEGALTYSLDDPEATFFAGDVAPTRTGVAFAIRGPGGTRARAELKMPGRHNVSNALAATAAACAEGVPLDEAAAGLASFAGVRRRFEVVGEAAGVTVIDDFGHNPDKIAATLRTLHEFPGRLLVMFQPHGFGPLRKMRAEFVDTFAGNLGTEDFLLMPQPVYHGGTVDRSVSSADIVAGVVEAGRRAEVFESREACGERLLELAREGDRIVVMGARDDTLSVFAGEVLSRLEAPAARVARS